MSGERARAVLTGTRFADVRWVATTGSTNADALALGRAGEPEGMVVVADHQTAGRGRRDRRWEAPPGAGLLVSVLLRPPARTVGTTPFAASLAVAEAVQTVTGLAPKLKWPNDLVWPGDGSARDRKLAGLLAEADWPPGADIASGPVELRPDERAVLVVGIGLNVDWPADVPAELADSLVAINHLTHEHVDREDLLIAFLRAFDDLEGRLRAEGPAPVLAAWREASATLGRRVRVDLGTDDVVGTAVDITAEGHLVVRTDEGNDVTLAVGDVVHLRE